MSKIIGLMATLLLFGGCAQDGAPNQQVQIYFVADNASGLRLFSETRDFPASNEELATKVLAELVSGQLQPLDPDYVNLWDAPTSLINLEVSDSIATINLNLGKLNVGAEGEARAIDQLVWTLTGILPDVTSVEFLVDGEKVETFAGHVDTTLPFVRGIDYETLSAIQIESINEGDEVSNPVVISGSACTFEANLAWSVSKEGNLIAEGFTTAAAACPERAEWSVDLPELEPGEYSFEAQELSPKDGTISASDSKTFAVR